MSPPKKIRQPTPDDIGDLQEIYDDMVELVMNKHADKKEHIVPTMAYIMAMSVPTRQDLNEIIKDIEMWYDIFQKRR